MTTKNEKKKESKSDGEDGEEEEEQTWNMFEYENKVLFSFAVSTQHTTLTCSKSMNKYGVEHDASVEMFGSTMPARARTHSAQYAHRATSVKQMDWENKNNITWTDSLMIFVASATYVGAEGTGRRYTIANNNSKRK